MVQNIMYVMVVSLIIFAAYKIIFHLIVPKAKRAITFTKDDNPPMIPLTISII